MNVLQLTVNIGCNFAHQRSEYAEKSAGPLYLQTPVGMHIL